MGQEIGTAYIQVVPSTQGISGSLSKLLKPEAEGAGTSAGDAIVKSLGAKLAVGIAALGIGKMITSAIGKAISSGSEYETALAKLGTIADTSSVSIADMSSRIRDMSDAMGISQASLAESAYSVISATGDTAGALDIVSQSAKLAKAGFTDTASATSVLATAMNSYKLSAEEVEHISDSLITTQNLGVTTVAELASNMGRAIASASAYGVSLENLESAYISTTKSGISTAESTTYITSMLTELGKEGSTVSDILKTETGSSFAGLMDSGKSLGDVLGILMDSVDGNSEAFMNLWGSQEAGKAANAIASQGIEEFNDHLKDLQNQTGTTESAYDQMMDTFGSKVEVIKTKFQNLGIQLFNDIAPALDSIADKAQIFISNIDMSQLSADIQEVANRFADWLANADVTSIIDGVGTLASALGGLIQLISLIAQGVGLIGNAVGTTVDFFVSCIDGLVGLIDGFCTAAQGGFQGIHDALGSLMPDDMREKWDSFASEGQAAMETVASSSEAASSRTHYATDSAVQNAQSKISEYASTAQSALDATSATAATSFDAFGNAASNATEKARGGLGALTDVSGSVSSAASNVSTSFDGIGNTASMNSAETSAALNEMSSAATTTMNTLKTNMSNGWNNVKTVSQTAVTTIKTQATTGFKSMETAINQSMNKIKSDVSNAMNSAKNSVSNGVQSMRSALSTTLRGPNIQLPHISVSGAFSINPPSAPTFSVSWYDKGGIFDRPTIIGVGERRPEFVGALDDLRGIVRDEAGGADAGTIKMLVNEIRNLGDRIESMEVVLDTGKAVGALTPGIDRELGRRMTYARRFG